MASITEAALDRSGRYPFVRNAGHPHRAITLTLSDTIPEEYPLSPKTHAKYGYQPLMTLQIYVKHLAQKAADEKPWQEEP